MTIETGVCFWAFAAGVASGILLAVLWPVIATLFLSALARVLRLAEGLLYGPLWLDASDALGRGAHRLEERAEAKEKP